MPESFGMLVTSGLVYGRAQVKQNTEMESHEEKLHKMIIQSKINDTKVPPPC